MSASKVLGVAVSSLGKVAGVTGTSIAKVAGVVVSVLAPCTWDPANKGSGWALSGGNLTATNTANNHIVYGTTSHSTGKRYFEITRTAGNNDGSAAYSLAIGVGPNGLTLTTFSGSQAAWSYYDFNGNKVYNNTYTAFGNTWWALNDVIGVALDADAGRIWFAKNGTWQASGDPGAGTNPAFTGLSGSLFPILGRTGGSASVTVVGKFKLADFTYTPPTGFGAWGG